MGVYFERLELLLFDVLVDVDQLFVSLVLYKELNEPGFHFVYFLGVELQEKMTCVSKCLPTLLLMRQTFESTALRKVAFLTWRQIEGSIFTPLFSIQSAISIKSTSLFYPSNTLSISVSTSPQGSFFYCQLNQRLALSSRVKSLFFWRWNLCISRRDTPTRVSAWSTKKDSYISLTFVRTSLTAAKVLERSLTEKNSILWGYYLC